VKCGIGLKTDTGNVSSASYDGSDVVSSRSSSNCSQW
jgi:hypothetical protein